MSGSRPSAGQTWSPDTIAFRLCVSMPDRLESKRAGNMNVALGAIALDTKHDRADSQSEPVGDQKRHLQVKFSVVSGTLDDQFQKDFPSYMDGLVASSPGSYVTLPEYPKKAEDVYNLKPRSDDVYVLTFPKCGTQTSFACLVS